MVECGVLYFADPHALRNMDPERAADALGWYLWRIGNPAGGTVAPMSVVDYATVRSPRKK
ncbi:unnamed protein product [marine sediment metagenome]|uniref:Uncharacterized protein n=1 Tax=marine sediment metagenome TaxID=412755 RepID=X0T363_9ZZZZ